MIVSFRRRGLKRLYEDDERRGLNPEHVRKIENILAVLDSASTIEGVDVHGFRLHPLTGDLKGFWSVTVRANWRVIFRFRVACTRRRSRRLPLRERDDADEEPAPPRPPREGCSRRSETAGRGSREGVGGHPPAAP